MNINILTVFILLITNTCLSQNFVDHEDLALKKYVGEVDQKSLFISSASDVTTGGIVVFDYDTLKFLKEFEKREFYGHIEWFIENNVLYSVSVLEKKNPVIQLNRYDSDCKLVDSLPLVEKQSAYHLQIKHIDHHIIVIGNPKNEKRDDPIFISVTNLISRESYEHQFALESKVNYKCASIVVNDRDEIIAIFEGRKFNTITGFSERPPQVLVLTPTTLEKEELISQSQSYQLGSFRLCKINNDKVLLGGLCFNDRSHNMSGYYTAKMEFGQVKLEDSILLKADKMADPAIWDKFQLKKIINDDLVEGLDVQSLQEIRMLNDGSFLFVSAGAIGGGGVSLGTPNLGISGSPNTTITWDKGPYNSGGESMIWHTIVSRIGVADKKVLWTWHHEREMAYIYVNESAEQLQLFYAEYRGNFDDSGKLKETLKTNMAPVSAALYTLKLSDGRGFSKSVYSDFKEVRNEVPVKNCSFINEKGEVVLFSAKIRYGHCPYRWSVIR